jgi:hypothetical protein
MVTSVKSWQQTFFLFSKGVHVLLAEMDSKMVLVIISGQVWLITA